MSGIKEVKLKDIGNHSFTLGWESDDRWPRIVSNGLHEIAFTPENREALLEIAQWALDAVDAFDEQKAP